MMHELHLTGKQFMDNGDMKFAFIFPYNFFLVPAVGDDRYLFNIQRQERIYYYFFFPSSLVQWVMSVEICLASFGWVAMGMVVMEVVVPGW